MPGRAQPRSTRLLRSRHLPLEAHVYVREGGGRRARRVAWKPTTAYQRATCNFKQFDGVPRFTLEGGVIAHSKQVYKAKAGAVPDYFSCVKFLTRVSGAAKFRERERTDSGGLAPRKRHTSPRRPPSRDEKKSATAKMRLSIILMRRTVFVLVRSVASSVPPPTQCAAGRVYERGTADQRVLDNACAVSCGDRMPCIN